MNDLTKIEAKPKSGFEFITDEGLRTNYILSDFWRWSVSDLISNATRGRFAEFIVGTALNFDPHKLRDEWGEYDLLFDDNVKIEVKSAAYIQSWHQNKKSPISFSIKPSKYWDAETGKETDSIRHADVYVFCLLKNEDQSTIDPMKMDQWDFFVIPTCLIDKGISQTSLSLSSINKLSNAIKYSEIKAAIIQAYELQSKSKDSKVDEEK
jgi:hypothetical protein